MKVQQFFDKITSTLTYVVYDEKSRDAVVIDPVLDFDPADGRAWYDSANAVLLYLKENKLNLHYILETHAHADHLSGAQVLKKKYPQAVLAIGENIREVQSLFKKVFNLKDLKADGSQFDRLLKEGEEIFCGTLKLRVIFTPGHTPACSSYLFEDSLFTGDSIFMPDSGTGRCDFPGGSAEGLYESIARKIYTLPDKTKIYVGHDYQPGGRDMKFQTTVGEQKEKNIHIASSVSKSEFLEFRQSRDKTLSAPRLLLPSIQVNIDAGRIPQPESNGVSYLKLPLKM